MMDMGMPHRRYIGVHCMHEVQITDVAQLPADSDSATVRFVGHMLTLGPVNLCCGYVVDEVTGCCARGHQTFEPNIEACVQQFSVWLDDVTAEDFR